MEQVANLLAQVDWDDKGFVRDMINPFPQELRLLLLKEYLSIANKFERNCHLRETIRAIESKLTLPLKELSLDWSEEELRKEAKRCVDTCLSLRRIYPDDSDLLLQGVKVLLRKKGVPAKKLETFSRTGQIGRLSNEQWWLRQIRRTQRRHLETVFHHMNQISRVKGLYCSRYTLRARVRQKEFQKEFLGASYVTNQFGQTFSLLELSQKSVSNPKLRKAELMVRARGFEDLAKELGHMATFLTITCPSKYHRCYSASGDMNPSWDGMNPLDGQNYLNTLWQQIRAKLDRLKVRFYGFRVAEPQHDGTPHWHLLLFVEQENYQKLVEVIRHYALREDREELGANEHRFKEVKIDPDKGSATGYIAKYVSKNIDGEGLDFGVYGEDPTDAAARVDAWASCWGIRQFQQLGGCSVTVWRELRRLRELMQLPELARKVVEAADKADWCEFTKGMGGVFCLRKQQLFQPYYELSVESDTGLIRTSRYCSKEAIWSLKGVVTAGQEVVTRTFKWVFHSSSSITDIP